MNKNENFQQTKYSDLVSRRNYSKISTTFEEPDLLEIQKTSYQNFLDNEVEKLVSTYFPIFHVKNDKYTIQYHGIKFAKALRTEEQARNEGKSYEKALYVDLSLVNNETGEVKRARKTKGQLCDGIFFANIPIMTDKGTFIINGIEKIVISQIVRSPGAYILSKSQIKLNNKKKVNEGYICEILPSKGTLINFWINEQDETVRIMMRNAMGDNAPTFMATQLLKGFGMTQDEIRRIFKDDLYIINTLYKEPYNHQNILDESEIIGIRKTIQDINDKKTVGRGAPIDTKLKQTVAQYYKEKKTADNLRAQYDSMFNAIAEENNTLNTQLVSSTGEEKEKIQRRLNSISKDVEKVLDKLNEQEQLLRDLIDIIITEKAAKDLITTLSISVKSIENFASSQKEAICYQDVIVRHFMDNRLYDLTSAGRYKLQRKLRISERLYGRIIAEDIHDKNDKVLLKKGTLILKDEIDLIKKAASSKQLKQVDQVKLGAENKITKKFDNAIEIFEIYTDNDLCDITTSIVGPAELIDSKALTIVDFVSTISYTVGLPHDIGQYDDIDHLGNKRLRLIHEQLKNKLAIGMTRVEKHVKEKLASISIATANEEQQAKTDAKTTIKSLLNTKPFQLMIKNFFNSYQLTQFTDQQNPLSELANKRRISAMGDGGISREDPNLDIRDVHYSHYSRICPIETPEGMNIGLIMSLAAFAKVDENGFLVAPYKKVIKGVVQDQIEWLTSLREDEYVICSATTKLDGNKIVEKEPICRYRSNLEIFDTNKIDYMEISPRQVVSIGAGLVPFLENDDTTRALMGANMQRQAVPLLKPYAPIVGTGNEYKVAHDSGMSLTAPVSGGVEYIDGQSVIIKDSEDHNHHLKLVKYRRSNQDTCINQSPIVTTGDKVKAGDILADGPAMQNGELALGRNPLIAFTTWNGYNYEDAIIISDRLAQEDVYTSININEYTIECLRTKNGDEEITRDLPNVGEEVKRYLDENGVIMVGAEIAEGDVLVGKVSPKGQVDVSAEEKLLQAIFGNKTKSFRDSSLKVPHGGEGVVIKTQHFSILNGDELGDDVIEMWKIFVAQKRKIQIGDKMAGRHGNKGIVSIVVPTCDMPHLEDGTPIDICLNPLGVPSRMNLGQIMEVHLGLAMRELAKKKLIEFVIEKTSTSIIANEFGLDEVKVKTLIKYAKKYFEESEVDSIEKAHRRIKEVDLSIILKNAGLAFEDLSFKAATPVFSGANFNDITNALKEAGIDPIQTKGKFKLIDGRSGDYFDNEITVGVMYMMKLDHMVDDKIHARCVGPYSKITQQPLGGKSQNGGQRFGEMEVWALEAYGASYNLRELLTIKSDDVKGRNLTYNAIVKGRPLPQPSLPESFKLLGKQLQGLGISINVHKEDGSIEDFNDFTSVATDAEIKESIETQETILEKTEQSSYEEDQGW